MIDASKELEAALQVRSPSMFEELRPGLSKTEIMAYLRKASIKGAPRALVELYTWKNGTRTDRHRPLEEVSLFPEQIYQFLDLESALTHWRILNEAAIYHPMMTSVERRYFPLFWDGATGYVGVDLKGSAQSPVVLIELESENPIREAYRAFDDFVTDWISANAENRMLTCFEH